MANDLTIRDLHSDMDKLRRTNNWGNAMISSSINRMNRDVNYSIVGSSMMLYSQLGEISEQNSRAFDDLSSTISGLSYDISRSASRVVERVSTSIRDAEQSITNQIRLSTSRLQLAIDNVQDAVERVNKQISELVKESQLQTTILSHINEGIHNPEIQKTNNGLEDYYLRNYESAIQSFDAALSIRLSLYLPHYFLGLIYSDKGDDNNSYDIDKAENEIKEAIRYGTKIVDKDPDVQSYMVLAYRVYANILRQKGQYTEAINQLDRGLEISSNKLEAKLLFAEEYVKNYSCLKEIDKALEYAKFGFENDATFVSLLVDDDLEDIREDLLRVVDECRVSFASVISELVSGVNDVELLKNINNSVSSDDAKTFLGRSKIINLLKKAEQSKNENTSDKHGEE